jgi:hypothetical protein
MVGTWGNGTPLLHAPAAEPDVDQAYHKDGTDHGNTQSTVRDVLPRHLIMFYYCHDTTLDMGPTGILPGSQYYGLDGEGARAGSSAEHGLPMSSAELMAAGDDLAARDASLDAAGGLLRGGAAGAEGELFGQLKMQVPAGTLAIVHHDMFHRQCRHGPDCVWRPVIKMGAVRLAEPLAAKVKFTGLTQYSQAAPEV